MRRTRRRKRRAGTGAARRRSSAPVPWFPDSPIGMAHGELHCPNEEVGASEGNPRHELVVWQATQRLSGRIAAVGPDLAKPADSGGSMGFRAVTPLAPVSVSA